MSKHCDSSAHQLKQMLTALCQTLSVLGGTLKLNFQVGTTLAFGVSWGLLPFSWKMKWGWRGGVKNYLDEILDLLLEIDCSTYFLLG